MAAVEVLGDDIDMSEGKMQSAGTTSPLVDGNEVTATVGDEAESQDEVEDNPHTKLKNFLQYVRGHISESSEVITQFAHLKISDLTEVSHPDFSEETAPFAADDPDSSQGQGETTGHSEEEHEETSEVAVPKDETANVKSEELNLSSEAETKVHDKVKHKGDEDEDKPEGRPCPYKVVWQRKDDKSNASSENQPYHPPTEAFGEEVLKVKIDAMSGERREIYILSDIHLGRPLAVCPGHLQLESVLSRITKAAAERKVHSVILLGDIFEMWVLLAAEPAWTDQRFLRHWEMDAICQVFIQVICNMVEEHGVDVYYVRGNHDHEITSAMIDVLFDGKVQFIPGILIYNISLEQQEYHVRFEHGHICDIVNSYSYEDADGLVCGRPMGYFMSRCVAHRILNGQFVGDGSDKSMSSLRARFADVMKSAGPDIMKLLCLPDIREEFLSMIIELCFGGSISSHAVVRMHAGTYVPVWKLPQYNFIQRLCDQEGLEKVFMMFLVWLDDFSHYLSVCEEDMVVVGHSHHWTAEQAVGRDGRPLLFANSGAWVDAEEVSYLRIVPPTNEEDGFVEVLHYPVNGATVEEHST